MNEQRQTIAVTDERGDLAWFPTNDARRWLATTLPADELFYVAGRWCLQDTLARLCGEPARVVDRDAAMRWLLLNGYTLPPELAEVGEARRLR